MLKLAWRAWVGILGFLLGNVELWKKICSNSKEFRKCIKWRVASSQRVKFWHEWLDCGALKSHFSQIFGGNSSWIVEVSRNLND